jgi:hypothetical protein
LDRKTSSAGTFTTLTTSLPVDFASQWVELRAFLKPEAVSVYFGLWLREDATEGVIGFDNMHNRQFKGTHDWTEYSIKLRPEIPTRKISCSEF